MSCLTCRKQKTIKIYKHVAAFSPHRPIFIMPVHAESVVPYMFKCSEGWGTRECFYICWYAPKDEKILHISRLVYVYDARNISIPEMIITYDYSREQNWLETEPQRHITHIWWNDLMKDQGRPILFVNTTNFCLSNHDMNKDISKMCYSDYNVISVPRDRIKKIEADLELYRILP